MEGFTNGKWRHLFVGVQLSSGLPYSRFAVPGGMAALVNEARSEHVKANTACQEICRSLASNLPVVSDRRIDH
jgi:hypothetical protein